MTDTLDLVGTAEASRILRVAVSTVTRWASDGTLEIALKLPVRNGAILFNRADILALKNKRDRDSRAGSDGQIPLLGQAV